MEVIRERFLSHKTINAFYERFIKKLIVLEWFSNLWQTI